MKNTRLLMRFVLVLVIAAMALPPKVSAQTTSNDSVLNPAGKSALVKGNYAEAESYFREALRKAEEENASPGRMSTALGNLAQALASQSRYQEAEQLFDRALTVEKTANVDPRVRTILVMNVASLYVKTDRFSRAESLLDEAVILCRKHFGLESPELASALKRQGILYAMTNRVGRGETRLKEALAIAEKQPAAFPPEEVATILTSLAGIYSMQKKWSLAEPLILRAVDLFERKFGPDHPGISDAMVNLGEQSISRRDFARAEAAFRRALSIRRAVFGPDHIEAALVATRLATVLTAQKKNEEAHRLFVASLPVQEKVLGSESPEFAGSLEEFGKLLRQMEDVAQAETIEARARNIRDTLAFTVSADRLGK